MKTAIARAERSPSRFGSHLAKGVSPMLASDITPGTDQQDLTDLADRIRAELQAAKRAWHNALGHALNVGQALLEAQLLVSGNWKRWLRDHCSLSVSTAQLYQQLARHRYEIEAEISRTPELSLRAARLLIARPKPVAAEKAEKSAKVSTQGQPEEEPTTSIADQLAELWAAASPEERMVFLDEITLADLLEVIPASWKIEIERRVISSLAARFPGAKTKPAIKAMQRLVEDTRLLSLKPAGSA
jgi:Protein of unknown function (DUF3102)